MGDGLKQVNNDNNNNKKTTSAIIYFYMFMTALTTTTTAREMNRTYNKKSQVSTSVKQHRASKASAKGE
jgi:hypothetical protein